MSEAQETAQLPQFLLGTVSRMSFRRLAGEWDLDVHASTVEDGRPWVRDLLSHFNKSFGWSRLRTLSVGVTDREDVRWSNAESADLESWFEQVGPLSHLSYGFQADTDLILAWTSPCRTSGRYTFPAAGRLTFDRQSLLLTHTIWINLFTDNIRLYDTVTEDSESRLVCFEPASERNRQVLRRSLINLELTCGTISAWTSELVNGVERYGFADTASPL